MFAGVDLAPTDGDVHRAARRDVFAVRVAEGAQAQFGVARVLDRDLVVDGLADLARELALGVSSASPSIFCSFSIVKPGSAGTSTSTLLEFLGVSALFWIVAVFV